MTQYPFSYLDTKFLLDILKNMDSKAKEWFLTPLGAPPGGSNAFKAPAHNSPTFYQHARQISTSYLRNCGFYVWGLFWAFFGPLWHLYSARPTGVCGHFFRETLIWHTFSVTGQHNTLYQISLIPWFEVYMRIPPDYSLFGEFLHNRASLGYILGTRRDFVSIFFLEWFSNTKG